MMSKRSVFILLICLLVLSSVAIYLYYSKGTTTTATDASRNFAFKDTASVNRVFIADKEGNSAEVKRTSRGWIVNNKYNCRGEAILNLLEVIRNVEVKMPVPRQAKENVIRIMAAAALKVEVYANDKLVKQYYVGHETSDGEGSYMLLSDHRSGKNFADPYVCFIPGFTGYLQPRFIAKEHEWRDRLAINYIPPEIAGVEMYYPGMPDSSFTIELKSTTEFRLTDGNKKPLPFEEFKMKQYLAYLQNLSYEVLITDKYPHLQDSLKKAGPFCQLTITAKPFRKDVFSFYRMKFSGQFNPELGVTYDSDPDRLYMNFSGRKEWAIVQYFVMGKLFRHSGYFNSDGSVKK